MELRIMIEKDIASLKCPYCGYIMRVKIPEDRCLVFWKCEKCQKLIKAPKEECCVICAYSNKKCPVHPVQKSKIFYGASKGRTKIE